MCLFTGGRQTGSSGLLPYVQWPVYRQRGKQSDHGASTTLFSLLKKPTMRRQTWFPTRSMVLCASRTFCCSGSWPTESSSTRLMRKTQRWGGSVFCHHCGLSGEKNRQKGWGRRFLKLYPLSFSGPFRSRTTTCFQTRAACPNSSGCVCRKETRTLETSPRSSTHRCLTCRRTPYPKSSSQDDEKNATYNCDVNNDNSVVSLFWTIKICLFCLFASLCLSVRLSFSLLPLSVCLQCLQAA